jgi:transposase-like protein
MLRGWGADEVIVYRSRVDLEGDLAAGRLSCSRCSGLLGGWGHARGRLVRFSGGSRPRWWRPRRARCRNCGVTQVLIPAWMLPRRRDAAEVIGQAVRAFAAGQGHRRIAQQLGRPPSTVRGWLRAFCGHLEQLRVLGTVSYADLDANARPLEPAGSPAADALEALSAAARSVVVRFGPDNDGPWAVINTLTGGGLLRPSSDLLPPLR